MKKMKAGKGNYTFSIKKWVWGQVRKYGEPAEIPAKIDLRDLWRFCRDCRANAAFLYGRFFLYSVALLADGEGCVKGQKQCGIAELGEM
jgi:hypothetical protein